MCRVFLARRKLIREPGCVGKMATPATTYNFWFECGFPRLARIFTRKTHKNSSSIPTSGSHNFFVRTSIHANFVSLESRRREISEDIPYDPFWAPEGLWNHTRKSGQKTVCTRKSRRIRRGVAWWIRSPRGTCTNSRGMVVCLAPWSSTRRATPPINKATPPQFRCDFAPALDQF